MMQMFIWTLKITALFGNIVTTAGLDWIQDQRERELRTATPSASE